MISISHPQKQLQGFTLLETLASISILALVIMGPLAVIINSSSYARQTKNDMIATYLAEEAVELVQNQYDSLYVYCTKTMGMPVCGVPANVNSGSQAWRNFKKRFTAFDGQPSCFLVDNPDGCSFDLVHMSGDITLTPVRYVSTNTSCKYITGINTSLGGGAVRHTYMCNGVPAHITGTTDSQLFTRSLTIEEFPTFEAAPSMLDHYQDDLRVTVHVGYRGVNGIARTITITRFMHSQP